MLAVPTSMRWILILVIAACSESGSNGPPPDDPFELACESQGAHFPLLEKACSVASDCFIALHQVSCCGTEVAIGLSVASQDAFTQAETECAGAYPGCGCASLPTAAEDGRSEVDGAIQVDCREQRCVTFVP